MKIRYVHTNIIARDWLDRLTGHPNAHTGSYPALPGYERCLPFLL